MIEFYDKARDRLVFVKEKADAASWDAHWASDDFYRQIVGPRNRFVINETKRYLSPGSRILDERDQGQALTID